MYNNDGTWIKSEFYVRDAQGNILSTYKHAVDASTQTAGYKQTERHLYGSSLLGIDQTQTELIGAPPVSLTTFSRTLGLKNYTGANHLGNDLVIFTDKKIGIDKDNDGIVNYYTAEVLSAKGYGPFGEYLTGRVFNASKYPNSFNGKRDDEELFGWQDYGFRNYMKAVRRFDRVDDLHKDFPWYSPYPFAGNKPVWAIDLDGLEDVTYTYLRNVETGETKLINTIQHTQNTGNPGEFGYGTQTIIHKTNGRGPDKTLTQFISKDGIQTVSEQYTNPIINLFARADKKIYSLVGSGAPFKSAGVGVDQELSATNFAKFDVSGQSFGSSDDDMKFSMSASASFQINTQNLGFPDTKTSTETFGYLFIDIGSKGPSSGLSLSNKTEQYSTLTIGTLKASYTHDSKVLKIGVTNKPGLSLQTGVRNTSKTTYSTEDLNK